IAGYRVELQEGLPDLLLVGRAGRCVRNRFAVELGPRLRTQFLQRQKPWPRFPERYQGRLGDRVKQESACSRRTPKLLADRGMEIGTRRDRPQVRAEEERSQDAGVEAIVGRMSGVAEQRLTEHAVAQEVHVLLQLDQVVTNPLENRADLPRKVFTYHRVQVGIGQVKEMVGGR